MLRKRTERERERLKCFEIEIIHITYDVVKGHNTKEKLKRNSAYYVHSRNMRGFECVNVCLSKKESRVCVAPKCYNKCLFVFLCSPENTNFCV